MKLTPTQKRLLKGWYRLTDALRIPRRVRDGIAWSIGFPPLAGAQPDPPADPPKDPPADPPANPPADPPPASFTPPDERTWSGTQQQLREAQQENEKLKKDERERQEKADREAGDHKAIADRAKADAETARQEADAAKKEAADLKVEREVEKIAARLHFRDPGDALRQLSDADKKDAASIETRLKAIATEKPYLTDVPPTGHTRDANGGDDQGGGGGGGGPATPQATGVDRLSRAYAEPAKK